MEGIKKFLKDVRICYREKWQVRYWRTITSCYNRSPYFEYYRNEFEKFFKNNWEFLFDWNLAALNWLKEVLIFPGEIIVTTAITGAEVLKMHEINAYQKIFSELRYRISI